MNQAEIGEAYRSMPVAEARKIVIDSGSFGGIEGPMFSNDGETWRDFWLPGEGNETPQLAKVTIYRTGMERGRTVVISWAEYSARDESEEWREKWRREPMTMFGSAAERHAYWVLFSDALEEVLATRVHRAEPVAAREWANALQEAKSVDELNALYQEALKAKAFVRNDELQAAFTRALAAAKAADAPKPVVPKPHPPRQGQQRQRGKRASQVARS